MNGYSIASILLAGRPLLPAGKGGLILIAGGLVMVTVALLWLTVAPPAPVVHRPVAPARPSAERRTRAAAHSVRRSAARERPVFVVPHPKHTAAAQPARATRATRATRAAREDAIQRAVAPPARRTRSGPQPDAAPARAVEPARRPSPAPAAVRKAPLDEVDAPLHAATPAIEGLIGPEDLGWAGFVTRRAARKGCRHVRLVESEGRHCTIEVDHDHHRCHRERRALASAAHAVSRKASVEQVQRGDTCVYEIRLEGKR